MKEEFSIGEISKIFGLNVQTLRFYDSENIFKPNRVDKTSGYRYYRLEQIYHLATICYLKNMGFSLTEIRTHLDSLSYEYSVKQLQNQIQTIKTKRAELELTEQAIQKKLDFIENRKSVFTENSFRIEDIAQRYYISLGSFESIFRDNLFYLNITVAFYKGKNKRFGVLIEEKDIDFDEVMIIPSGRYLCYYHMGSYGNIEETIENIRQYGKEHGLSLASSTVNINTIDQFIEKDSSNYATEVQIKILDHEV